MGVTEREAWLDLLHREADGDPTPAERARLAALAHDPAFAELRRQLTHAAASLSALSPPALPHSLAAGVTSDIVWRGALQGTLPSRLPASVAAQVAGEVGLDARLALAPIPALPRSVAAEVAGDVRASAGLVRSLPSLPSSLAGAAAARIAREGTAVRGGSLQPVPAPAVHNPAPLLLVSGLLVGLTLLGVTNAWPNLAAGATVLQTLIGQVSPLAGAGLLLLLAVSALVVWRPAPAVQRLGAGAFVLAAALTLPPLYQAFGRSGVTVGHDVTVHGSVPGNVIAVGGNVLLAPDARVGGEVITLFGDVRREAGASVAGRVNALLGHAPGDATALQTAPPPGLSIATATAFRPLLGWLGGAAWSPVFLVLTGGMLLLLFVTGAAPLLARRQRHAPLRTLALGVLALAVLIGPALGLALAGLLVPALLATAFALLLVATGLSVSAYDAGRALAFRLHLPLPDALGALLGLGAVAASLSVPPLALTFALIGGAWGAGTLLLTRSEWEGRRTGAG